MKHLRETFTDEEWKLLQEAKNTVDLNWHDFIMLLKKYTKIEKLKDKFGAAMLSHDYDVAHKLLEEWMELEKL
jgi:hypothetical protein